MVAGGLEQVERAVGIDAEVRLRIAGSPVVRGLGGGVDDQLDFLAGLGEDAVDAVRVADVEVDRAEGVELPVEALGHRCGRCLRAEKHGAGVVLDPDHVITRLDQTGCGLGTDQSTGSCDYRLRHVLVAPFLLLEAQRRAQLILVRGRPVKQVSEHVAGRTARTPRG